MNAKDQFFKEVFESYFTTVLSELLPNAIKEAVSSSRIGTTREFISLTLAGKRYNLSRKTFYNYHQKGYITLHSSEGKTFVSVIELESHIRRNPLPRNRDF